MERNTAERIIFKPRQAGVLSAKGIPIAQSSKQIGRIERTYYRWRREYGGLKNGQARGCRELEKENTRLKKAVAELALGILI